MLIQCSSEAMDSLIDYPIGEHATLKFDETKVPAPRVRLWHCWQQDGHELNFMEEMTVIA